MNVKKKDLKAIADAVVTMGSGKIHKKLAYALVMNKKILEGHLQALQEVGKFPEAWQTYDTIRHALCQEYATKDENGSPLTKRQMIAPGHVQEVFDIAEETKDEFAEKMQELNEEHKDAFEEKAVHEKELLDVLEEEVEIDFYTVKMEYFPDEMTAIELESLIPIIDNDE